MTLSAPLQQLLPIHFRQQMFPAVNVLTNNFTMINSASDGYYEPCIGGKEGYTEASGSTLVCEASKNNMKLVCIVLNGASGVTDDEAIALLNYGFDNFAPLTIADDDFNCLPVVQSLHQTVPLEDNLTTEDTSSDGQITRQYYFEELPVGTAILEDAEQQTNDAAVTGQKNMEAAQAYSASHTTAPYYIIGRSGQHSCCFPVPDDQSDQILKHTSEYQTVTISLIDKFKGLPQKLFMRQSLYFF